MGLLLALQLVDLVAGSSLVIYLATARHQPWPSAGGAALPHLCILGVGVALRGLTSLILRCSARSFRAVATPVWVVGASLCTTICAIVELVHWRASAPRAADDAAARAETLALRFSIGAMVWLCLAALAQEGLLRAAERRRGARPPSGGSPRHARLLEGVADGADVAESGAPAADGGERGLGGKASRIYALARPEWPALSVGLLALLGSSLSNLLIPKFFGGLVNSVVDRDAGQLATQTSRLVLILVVGALLTFVRAFLFNSAGERVVSRLRGLLFARMLSQEAAFFDSAKSGELVSRLTSDCTKLQSAATSDLSLLLRSVMMVLLSVVLMATTQWKLTLVCLAVVPPMAAGGVLYGRAIRTVSKAYQDAVSRASDASAESLGAVKTVRAFGAEPLHLAMYVRAVGDPDAQGFWAALGSARAAVASAPRRRRPASAAAAASAAAPSAPSAYALGVAKALYLALFVAGVTFAFYLAIAAILWYGCELVLSGDAALGDLVGFVMYAVQIGASLGALASLFSAFMEAVGASERVFQIIERPPALPSILEGASAGVVPRRGPPRASGGPTADEGCAPDLPRVEFAAVDFAYPGRPSEPVLRGFHLRLPLGSTAAIVGSSGAGKSTVAGLLMRLYEPTAGCVLVDGVDLRAIDLRWLRAQVAMVAQEPVLFAASIAENIAYGAKARAAVRAADAAARERPGARAETVARAAAAEEGEGALRARVEAAAARAHAADFIAGFPQGYETLCGERGLRLSGGQKQRIAIARALLHDPPILILDEATSALDAESESLVQAALETLVADRTTLVIAHRLSTVVRADQIVCLAGGRVAGAGAHAQLLASCPEYAALVHRQLHAADGGAAQLLGEGALAAPACEPPASAAPAEDQ